MLLEVWGGAPRQRGGQGRCMPISGGAAAACAASLLSRGGLPGDAAQILKTGSEKTFTHLPCMAGDILYSIQWKDKVKTLTISDS